MDSMDPIIVKKKSPAFFALDKVVEVIICHHGLIISHIFSLKSCFFPGDLVTGGPCLGGPTEAARDAAAGELKNIAS